MSNESVAPRGDGYREHPFVPQTDFLDHTVTNQARPLTSAIITVRIIKNFEYRTMKPLVLKDVDLTTLTAPALIEKCRQGMYMSLIDRGGRTARLQSVPPSDQLPQHFENLHARAWRQDYEFDHQLGPP